ncbi:protein translocase subunit SecD [Candidatus Berkelbacteria bacterium]|nr:protein translocase subunit SecD [Candidatus Berkelbacteria bacterium]
MAIWPTDVWFVRGVTIHPGLDLRGGTQLVYELQLGDVADTDRVDAIEGVREAITRRVDQFGVAEPVIQSSKVGEREAVIVELPGVQDVAQAKALIGKTAKLEFWEPATEGEEGARATFFGSFAPTDLSGADLTRASVQFQGGDGSATSIASEPVVQLEFNDAGRDKFKRLTEAHIGEPIAIFLDEELITAPTVQAAITDGTAIVSGQFDIESAKQLAIQLNAGALPVPISLVEERTIGATLGTESVQKSLVAGVVGFLLIGVFMTAYYRLAGFVATIALAIYTTLTLAIFELIPVTLTLAGIAGFVLSIGMAVDANVLIFERMREELRAGKPLNLAIDEGFRRAWSSIVDSNVSSLITAAILYYTTTGLVRGFAVTLAIGILVSMFTAITVTRMLLRLVLRQSAVDALPVRQAGVRGAA